MKLRKYVGKNVKIIDVDGEEYVGKIGDYIWPDDNEPEVEAVILDNPEYANPVQFNATDIKSIEIIS